jgi:ribosomal protein L7Ae-like RNA K-turn-binding protein
VYLCPSRDCLEQALKRKTLEHALGEGLAPVSADLLRMAVRQTVFSKVKRLLGLARRARKVMVGHEAVAKTLEAGRLQLLVLSQDISPGEGERFIRDGDRRAVPVVVIGLSREEFGEALGGPPRGVAGITDARFAEGITKAMAYVIPEG